MGYPHKTRKSHQGYNPLVAIQMALSGELYAEPGE